ncbi:MAG: hypothetical protein RLZ37_2058 [Actinomycetota bacterium]|jgi:hypothetical protein
MHESKQCISASFSGTTGLKSSPPPTSDASMIRSTFARRQGDAFSTNIHASGHSESRVGRWLSSFAGVVLGYVHRVR